MKAMRWIETAIVDWNSFWFEADFERQALWFRRVVGTMLAGFYLIRGLDLEFLFGESGILPLSSLETIMMTRTRYTVFQAYPGAVVPAHWALIVSLLLMAWSKFPKPFAILAWLLEVSFLHRNLAVHFGADFIALFFMFYLCGLSPWKEGRFGTIERQFASVAFRLSQIQLGVIYFYAGVEKLKGTMWWKGEALWLVLSNPQLARYDFWWTIHLSFFLVLGSYITLLWEIFFGVLVWNPKLRAPILIFGALFHFGIAITVKIPFFSSLMIACYLLFCSRAFLDKLERLPGLVMPKALRAAQIK